MAQAAKKMFLIRRACRGDRLPLMSFRGNVVQLLSATVISFVILRLHRVSPVYANKSNGSLSRGRVRSQF